MEAEKQRLWVGHWDAAEPVVKPTTCIVGFCFLDLKLNGAEARYSSNSVSLPKSKKGTGGKERKGKESKMKWKLKCMIMAMVLLFLVLGCVMPFETPPSVFSPITIELAMSKAPRLNEPARITCIIKSASPAPNSVAEIELPSGAELIDGNLSWQGDLEPGSPVQLSGTIKFIEEGEWTIRAFAKHVIDENEGWGDEEYIYVTVTKLAGKFGWDTKSVSQAAQIDPTPTPQRPERPITVKLDIPEPPRLDESVQLTWSITSIQDIPEVTGEVVFYIMEGSNRVRISTENVLIEGDLTWKGSLKKDNPVNFSATIKFPQEGYWDIHLSGYSCLERKPINTEHGLLLTVSKEKSSWGWTDYDQTPPPADEPLTKCK